MNQEYTLRIPFQFLLNLEISNLEEAVTFQINNLYITLEQSNEYYVIYVKGFNSEQEAKDYISCIWSSLAWTLLHKGTAFLLNMDFDPIFYPVNPQQAAKNLGINDVPDGFSTEGHPIVYPTQKRIRLAVLGNPQLKQLVPASEVVELVTDGLTKPFIEKPFHDPKLRTALELYSAYHHERSHTARFLTLMMILETLTEYQTKPKISVDLLSKWHSEVLLIKQRLDHQSDDFSALESLERELFFRKDMSIRSRVRALVYETLSKAGHPEASKLASDALKAYDRRSTLVHQGSLPMNEMRKYSKIAHEIVRLVLKAKFLAA